MNLSLLFSTNQNRWFNLIFGLIFIAFFAIGFKAIHPMFYLDRDDGIISFSHVINLEQFGFLGVSPSGERIESFSTPIHILFFFIFRTIFGLDYHAYGIVQSLLSGFFIGYLLILFFNDKDNLTKFFVAALSGCLLVLSIRFFQWHNSGLENPLTSVFFLFFGYQLIQSGKNEVSFWSGISFGLASITRIESIFFTFPLIGLFWLISGFKVRFLVRFILPGIVFLAVIHLSRFVYFGDFFPNTAKGQSISLSQNLQDTFLINPEYWVSNLKVFILNFRYNHGFLLLTGLLFLVFFKKNQNRNLVLLLISFLVLSFFHLFIFNATRLDPIRYASYLAPLGVLAALMMFLEAKERLSGFVFYAAFLPCFSGISFLAHKPIFQICCEDKIFLRWNKEMTEMKSDQNWHRPLVANPDLGIVSYRKEYNILDLGLIGSKLTANLLPCSPMKRELFFEFAKPEMIRIHANWADLHKDLFKDPRIWEIYETIWTNKYRTLRRDDSTFHGFFVRKEALINSGSEYRKEYENFSSKILNSAKTEAIGPFFQKLEEVGNPNDFGRLLFEFLPELRRHFAENELQAQFDKLKIDPFYRAWLRSAFEPNWYKSSQDAIFQSMQKKYPPIDSVHLETDVKWMENQNLIFIRSDKRNITLEVKERKNNGIRTMEIPSRNLFELNQGFGFILEKQFGKTEIASVSIQKNGEQIFRKSFPKKMKP